MLSRGCKFFAGARFESDPAGGVNPMGPLYEILTDDLFGAGLPEAQMNATSFQDTATALAADGILLSPLLLSSTSLRAFIADYLQYFDGFLRRNGTLLEAGYFSHGAIDTSGLLTLGSNDLTSEPQIQPSTLEDTKNYFTVEFTNRDAGYTSDYATHPDLANFQEVGEQRDDAPKRPFIITAAGAQRFITEYGVMKAALGANGSLEFLREKVASLLPGDRFNTDSASFGLEMLVRILNAKRPADKDGVTQFDISVERADWEHLFIQPPAPKDPDFKIVAVEIDTARIVDLPSQLRDADALEVAVLAERPSAPIIGFRTHVSTDDITYDLVATQRTFAVHGKIVDEIYPATGPIVDDSVGMVVELYGVDLGSIVSQSDQQRDDQTLLCWVGHEMISVGTVTALGAGKYRIFGRRAIYGTVQAAHAIDSDAWFVFRDQIVPIAHAIFIPGDTVHFKLQPFTATENIDIADVDPIDHTFGAAPFVLSGLELAGQGADLVFTGRTPRFRWRIFSAGGAEITGPQLSLGAWDDRFGWFELRVRDADTGDTVWTGQSKVPEAPFPHEDNALASGGPRRSFFFDVAAVVKNGSAQTPWLANSEPFENPNETFDQAGYVGGGINSIDFYLSRSPALDHAGCLLWRSLDPDFEVDPDEDWTVVGAEHDGVQLVFKGPDLYFSIPQPEGTTFYYRVAAYDDFWTGSIADLIIGPAIAQFTLDPSKPPPAVSPGSHSFTDSFVASMTADEGIVVRYRLDGTEATIGASEWPKADGVYTTLPIADSCILRVRGFDVNGVPTKELVIIYTKVASGGGGERCGGVSIRFSGRQNYTAGTITLRAATSGGTIHYSKDGAAYVDYTAPFALSLDEGVEAYESAPGFTDGPVSSFDNADLSGR